jgi:hypothetical protein
MIARQQSRLPLQSIPSKEPVVLLHGTLADIFLLRIFLEWKPEKGM